ncbi:MAG TPA: response regulator [Pyrinomonadaceae bacterium]|nr:response regulator [Pyrinomonadaceae bacterium]
MLTGRKLLLADDSAAIRKVIELTFSDEGMEVITVPDGRSAFEKMGQVRPDLVLADVYMPEVGGYELCRSIKQDERYAKIPVVLLISSFEPFDEAEARRAGADDVVTKPFQSIRQLVSRVGSLLNKTDEPSEMTYQYPTLGMTETEPVAPAPLAEQASEPQVTVMVEAPMMEHLEPAESAGVACPTDLELQTADTMKLERIVDQPDREPVGEAAISLDDTIEVEPVVAEASDEPIPVEPQPEPETVEISYGDISEPVQVPPPSPMKFDDAVLDLEDEFLGEPQMVGDDVFLDLDFADAVRAEAVEVGAAEEPSAPMEFAPPAQFAEAAVEIEPTVAPVIYEPPAIVTPEEPEALELSVQEPVNEPVAEQATAPFRSEGAEGLSPAAIDAIARRLVEQMSDKVIREIAWEVVPELSELLIKRKLDEQK